MRASEILNTYISFFEKRDHVRIANSSLVPENDPTTLFTSSGMQPLVPYLLGEAHPSGKRLVNVQNCFRAQDIDEIGDNRHITFFRMLGNWSLGDYFKKEQIPFFFEFLTSKTDGIGLDPQKLYVTVFEGFEEIQKDEEAISLWQEVFKSVGIDAKVGESALDRPSQDGRIFTYGVGKNWWSRSGTPDKMPIGEPGGPDTEVFYDFGDDSIHKKSEWKNEACHVNCDCGRYMEIGNSVFMQFKKDKNGFEELSQKNVDFGGGLERLVAASENKQDLFETSLFQPIIKSIEMATKKEYRKNPNEMRIILDHFVAAVFIINSGVKPSNKEQGYILRRLIRRGLDNMYVLGGQDLIIIIEKIVEQYQDTDPDLPEKYEEIKFTILEEENSYKKALSGGQKLIEKELRISGLKLGDELTGVVEISAELAFKAITSFGLGPTQLKSLGYTFDEKELAQKIKEHQNLSRKGANQKFTGGLADHEELTIKGHTATHLLQQALRDVLGDTVFQTGSNITTKRLRFDFSYDKKLTNEQTKEVENIVLSKINENLTVYFLMLPVPEAKKLGAIGLFDEKYDKTVKVYCIGGNPEHPEEAYSKEFCGGPHVEFTGRIKSFKIIKEEGVSKGVRRIYAVVA